MASKTQVIVTMTDDIDGSVGAKTIKFGLDEANYTIDLKPEHEAQLREALALFIGHAKLVPIRKAATHKRSTRSTSRAIEVREWARSQGMTVPERGRISKEIIDAYEQAHSTHKTTPEQVVYAPPATLLPAEPVPTALV